MPVAVCPYTVELTIRIPIPKIKDLDIPYLLFGRPSKDADLRKLYVNSPLKLVSPEYTPIFPFDWGDVLS